MSAQTDAIQCMFSLYLVFVRCTALFVGFVMFFLKIPVEKRSIKVMIQEEFQWIFFHHNFPVKFNLFQWNSNRFFIPLESSGIPPGIFYGVKIHRFE